MTEEKSKQTEHFSLYYKIRKWIQPFWNPKPKKKKKPREKSFSTHGKETDLIFVESKKPLTKAFEFEKRPSSTNVGLITILIFIRSGVI